MKCLTLCFVIIEYVHSREIQRSRINKNLNEKIQLKNIDTASTVNSNFAQQLIDSFPTVEYPSNILDINNPFYFNQGYHSILGPFTDDVKTSYNFITTKTNNKAKSANVNRTLNFIDLNLKDLNKNKGNIDITNSHTEGPKYYDSITTTDEQKNYDNITTSIISIDEDDKKNTSNINDTMDAIITTFENYGEFCDSETCEDTNDNKEISINTDIINLFEIPDELMSKGNSSTNLVDNNTSVISDIKETANTKYFDNNIKEKNISIVVDYAEEQPVISYLKKVTDEQNLLKAQVINKEQFSDFDIDNESLTYLIYNVTNETATYVHENDIHSIIQSLDDSLNILHNNDQNDSFDMMSHTDKFNETENIQTTPKPDFCNNESLEESYVTICAPNDKNLHDIELFFN